MSPGLVFGGIENWLFNAIRLVNRETFSTDVAVTGATYAPAGCRAANWKTAAPRALAMSALLALSQVACAAGYFRESRQALAEGNPAMM